MAKQILTDYDFVGVGRVRGLPAPTLAGDAANKQYVDSTVEGLKWKASARVATTSNTNLLSGAATIDGVTMTTGDRVLVRSQTTTSQNGIYLFNGAGSAMTRTVDADSFAELEQAIVSVEEGSSADSTFRQTEVNGTLNVDPVIFAPFGTSAPSASETTAGIAEIATQVEVDTGLDDNRFVTPAKLANWSGRTRRFGDDVGDGAATSYVVSHNFNTRDVSVAVYENSGSRRQVDVEVQLTSVNSVTVLFTSAPASDAYRVVILG